MKTGKLFVLAIMSAVFAAAPAQAAVNVSRATLSNGLRIVVVHDSLAPVVQSMLNYRVGGNEEQYPGEAHALEHMMFRGTKDISQTQLFEIGQLMGGAYDADTQSEITQYFFEVPTQYLDVALRVEADRARGALLQQSGWIPESGAIKQEVTQDDSVAVAKLFERTILPSIFKGTPYANDVLGTLHSFNDQINASVIRKFYDTWYHPNNAVLIVAGNVDGPSTIAKVKRYFGAIPAAKLPARKRVVLQPMRAATYHVVSDQPYTLIAMAFRLPGWNDKDYAAAQILESVLNNQRGNLFGLTATGKALYTTFQDIQTHGLATASAALSVVPVTTDPNTAANDLKAVFDDYRKTGVPADLVEVAKQRAIADAEFRSNSIGDLANEWSEAVAVRGQSSPDADLAALKSVTVADVNAVLRKYVDPSKAIVAYAVPKNTGAVNAGSQSLAKENNTLTPQKSQPLPAWAQAAFATVRVPEKTTSPTSMTLSNGMRLIVQPETVSNTVEVRGSIQSNEAVQAPEGKLGVADITAQLFPFGSKTASRLQLREQLDKIAADATAGTEFSLSVLSANFDEGLRILADEELHPAFPAQAFAIVKQQAIGILTGQANSPDFLTGVALNKALLPATDPLQKHPTAETATAVTTEDVQNYFNAVYRPDMTTVVVIGNITPEHARAAFEKYFGEWKATGPKPDVTLPQVPKNAAASVIVPDQGRVQSDVTLAQVMDLRRNDPDWATLTVANTVLGGGGFGSILMDDLRVKHGYVYDAHSSLNSNKERATFSISYACDPDKIVPAEQLARNDVQLLRAGSVSTDRLTRAKVMLMSDVPLSQESFGGVASALIQYATFGLPLDQMTIDARNELSVTGTRMKDAVDKWIDPNDFVRVVKGPGPK